MFKKESYIPQHKDTAIQNAESRFPNVTEGKKRAAATVVDRYFPALRGLTEAIHAQDMWVGPALPVYLATEQNTERKSEFLTNFFSSEGINLPQGDKLGSYLGTLSSYRWFSPTGKLTPDNLSSLVNLHLERMKSRPSAIKLLREEETDEALGDALKAMRTATVDMETKTALSSLNTKRREIVPDDLWLPVKNVITATLADNAPGIDKSFEARFAAIDAQKANPEEYVFADRNEEVLNAKLTMATHLEQAASSIITGATGKKDAYAPLTAIYRYGLWPIGIVSEQQEKKRFSSHFKNTREYVIFSPKP